MSTKIQITLSSANMGPQATEADFDAWVAYVAREIDEALGIDAEVDQFAFTGPGFEGEDAVSGGTAEQREDVKRWLSGAGWEAFCAEGGAALAREEEDRRCADRSIVPTARDLRKTMCRIYETA